MDKNGEIKKCLKTAFMAYGTETGMGISSLICAFENYMDQTKQNYDKTLGVENSEYDEFTIYYLDGADVKNISTPDIKKYLNIEVDVYGNFSEKNIEI
jgi:hypothetical protein